MVCWGWKEKEKGLVIIMGANTERVSAALGRLGFVPWQRGYKMLCPGIAWYWRNQKTGTGQELYLWLGEEFGGTSSQNVRQNIEYSIRDAWEKGSREEWARYFPGCSRAPANLAFIATMAAHLYGGEETA